jgi:hypothetical protein
MHCGKEIIVKYLKAGDEAICRNCGRANRVPEDAVPTEEAPGYMTESGRPPAPPRTPQYGAADAYGTPPGGLGPRNLGNILGEVFSAYGEEFLRLMGVVIGPTILMFALAYIPRIYGENILERGGEFSLLLLLPLIPYFAIYIVVAIVTAFLMEGALIYVMSARYAEGAGGVGRAFRFAWGRLLPLIGARLIVVLVMICVLAVPVGLIVVMAPAGPSALMALVVILFFCIMTYLWIIWIFSGQAVLLENRGPIDALSRSYSLITDHWWRVFGISLLVGLIFGVLALILSLSLTLIFREAGSLIVQILLAPVSVIITTVLYFDIRTRKEGFAVGDLRKALGVPEDRLPPSGP